MCVCDSYMTFAYFFYVLHFKILIGSDRAATKRKEKKKNGEKPKPILCHNLKLCFKFVCARFLSFTFQPLCSIIIRSDSNIGRVNGDHDRKFSFTKNFINAKIRSHIKTWNKTTANLKEKMNFESLAFIGTHSHIYRYKLCTFQVLCNLFNVFFFPLSGLLENIKCKNGKIDKICVKPKFNCDRLFVVKWNFFARAAHSHWREMNKFRIKVWIKYGIFTSSTSMISSSESGARFGSSSCRSCSSNSKTSAIVMSVCVCVSLFSFFRVLRSVLFYLFVVLVVFAYLDVVWRRAVVVTWLAGLFVCFCCRSRQNTPPTVSLTRYQQEKESEKSRQWNWIKFVCIIRAWIFVTESIYICYTYECMSFTHAQVLSFACFFFFSFRSVFRPRRRLRRCLFYTSITLVFVDVVVGAILLSNSALYKSYTTPSMHRVVGGSFVCICWGSLLKWISACLCMCPLPFCLFFGFVSFLS